LKTESAILYDQMVIKDSKAPRPAAQSYPEPESGDDEMRELLGRAFRYDRLAAVRYAETYWNKRNPAYKNFEDNCTNFISQCIRAGDAADARLSEQRQRLVDAKPFLELQLDCRSFAQNLFEAVKSRPPSGSKAGRERADRRRCHLL
jgi:hypothetical protein